MNWKTTSKNEANTIMLNWGDSPNTDCDSEYQSLRTDLLNAMKTTAFDLDIDKNGIKNAGYEFDLSFGLKLYSILTKGYQMNPRIASDNNVWRFLSIKIVPDIVYYRWEMNPSRFWKESRRIWLKTLWWYVYLSWQGSIEDTKDVLKGNTTDEIVQLVERSGPSGYRVETYRRIMEYYGTIEKKDMKKRNNQIFRRVMKLNTARTKVVEPTLVTGGERMYVKELFNYLESDS